MKNVEELWKRLEPLVETDADVVRHAVWVSVWGRWFIWLVGAGMLVRRMDLWYPEQFGFLYLNVSLAAINAFVHYRLVGNRQVTWRWMIFLSAVDLALITANVAVNVAAIGNLDNVVFITYYPALAIFAVVFSSIWLILIWVTMTALVYSIVAVTAGPGVGLEVGQDNVMLARLAMMYLVPLGVSLIVRFERSRRRAAMARERRAQQERIELSQEIHDTTAQTAYTIGLGLESAIKLAGDSNPKLTERLAATAALSTAAIWELRRPIDAGRIFEGRDLGRVLGSHTMTFAQITSVPVEMVQTGQEPPMATEVRAGLFTIAHNALTNAFLHSHAGRVEVTLGFESGCVRMSVSDDGIGLPEDYAERGRGFSGMNTVAERMGGRLVVESGGPGVGTTVTCTVPPRGDQRRRLRCHRPIG